MIGLLSWLVAGLVAGVTGRLFLPGPRGSWPATLVLSLASGALGGVLATLLGMGGTAELDPRGLVLAFLMAALTVILAQLLRALRAPRDR